MIEWSPSKLMIQFLLLLSCILLVSSTGVQQPLQQPPQPSLHQQPLQAIPIAPQASSPRQSSPPQPQPQVQQIPLLQPQQAPLQQQHPHQAAQLAQPRQQQGQQQQVPLPQQSPVTAPLSSPQPVAATSLSLSNINIDDELLRCPAVEFLPALKMNENNDKYQIQFIPQDDVKWVIAHLQINEGVQLNVPLNIRSSSRDQLSDFERLSKHLEQDEQDDKDVDDEDLFNRELDDLLDQFNSYSKRSRYGGRMGTSSSPRTSGAGPRGGTAGAATAVDPPSEQRWTKPEPSLSVTHKADIGAYLSGMGMNFGAMQGPGSSTDNPKLMSSTSSSSSQSSPNPRMSSPFATMGQAKSSMNRQQNEFLTKQIRLARAMIELKEGQSGAAPMRGEVGVWIHNDGIDLNDNDVLRVWFTYRATEEPMAVDCDTHTFLFTNEGLKRTPVTTLRGEKKAELKTGVAGGARGTGAIGSGTGERQAIPAPLQRTRQWKKGGMRAKPMRGSPKAWGRMKGIVPAQLTTTTSPFEETSQTRQQPMIGAAQAAPPLRPFAGPTTKAEGPSDEEICASATGDASLKLQYPDLALAGEKNTYALILNITTPDNIRWVDVHYLAEGSRLVKLRMSPIPSTSVAPQTWQVTQPIKGGSSSSGRGFRKSLAMNLAQPQWIKLDSGLQGQQQQVAGGRGGMKQQMNVDPMNGVEIEGEGGARGSVRGDKTNLFAEGSLLFSGSINASDISHIEIDPKTGQPISVSIGELTLSLNVVGLPGSTFVLVANDDASDLRHWKSKLKEMPQLTATHPGGQQHAGGDDDEEFDDDDQYDDDYYYDDDNGEYYDDNDDEGQFRAQRPVPFIAGSLGGQLQQQQGVAPTRPRSRVRGAPPSTEDIGEEEEYYPPQYQPQFPQRRPFIPRPYPGMGPLGPQQPNVPSGMIPPWFRRPGIRPTGAPGEAEEETPLGPQLFQHPNGLMLNEGDKIRVFFSFFSPPVYCRTKSFTLIAPNVTHATLPEPTPSTQPSPTPTPTPSPAPAPSPAAPTTNETSAPSNETGTPGGYEAWLPLKQKMTSRRLAFGRVKPGQFRERPRRRPRDREDDVEQDDSFNRDRPRRRRPIDRVIPTPTTSTGDQSKKVGGLLGRFGEQALTCQQMMNFVPKLSILKGLSNHELDQNNYAIVFNAPRGNEDSIVWVDVHYQKNNEVERNYRMEMISFGRFEHIEPGWHEGIHLASCNDVLKYSFTFRIEGVESLCDTQQFIGIAGKCRQQQPSLQPLSPGEVPYAEGPSIPGERPGLVQQQRGGRLAGSGIFHRFRASPAGQRLARRMRSRPRLTTGGTGTLNAIPLTSGIGAMISPVSPQLQPMTEKGKKGSLAVPLIPTSPSPSPAVSSAPSPTPATPIESAKPATESSPAAEATAKPSPSPVESVPAPSKTTSEAAPPSAAEPEEAAVPARVGGQPASSSTSPQISPSMTPTPGMVPAVWTTSQQGTSDEVEEKKK